jgi:hypothetical protein
MLGGLRVGNPLREWITDAAIGGQFAINFFTNFLENVRPATRSSMSNAKALWKDIPSEMFGVIGFEFSVCFFEPIFRVPIV